MKERKRWEWSRRDISQHQPWAWPRNTPPFRPAAMLLNGCPTSVDFCGPCWMGCVSHRNWDRSSRYGVWLSGYGSPICCKYCLIFSFGPVISTYFLISLFCICLSCDSSCRLCLFLWGPQANSIKSLLPLGLEFPQQWHEEFGQESL